eukprot:TRINITY_DN7654_c0_g1_i8.p1 TRINITY_DN7654_c0_g1~~TRINITY_DN7654_c0_g1_i8.p1  ORF type:complete len:284 (+),score=88.49 TRINITY_DN7654_c0_g1_i8:30-854(+)
MKSNNTVYMATIVLMALVGTSLAVQPIKVTPPTTYPKAPKTYTPHFDSLVKLTHQAGNLSPLGVLDSPQGKNTFCKPCVEFMLAEINVLLNEILNGGVLGTCSDLCSKLSGKDASEACDIICAVVGIDEFIKILTRDPPNPITLCQDVKFCSRCVGAVKMGPMTTAPSAGSVGTTFDFTAEYEVLNTTCTGMFRFKINSPDPKTDGGIESDFLDLGQDPGTYGVKFQVQAAPQQGIQFNPGNYQAEFMTCDNMCGDPGTKTLGVSTVNFTITAK